MAEDSWRGYSMSWASARSSQLPRVSYDLRQIGPRTLGRVPTALTVQMVSVSPTAAERVPRRPGGQSMANRRNLGLRTAWHLAWPVRWYWSHSQRQLGKKLVVEKLIKRMVPAPPAGFETELPGGGRIFLHHRADIGLVVLMSGNFECAETTCARELAREGTVAIDVGANVGMFTIPLALAVGDSGRVLAIEPWPENVAMLNYNLRLNALRNVVVRDIAASAECGEVLLHLGSDPAFHSTTTVVKGREAGENLRVPSQTLDAIWEDSGTPEVSFLKIDTEGGEFEILEGATRLLRTWRPAILLEAKGERRAKELDQRLLPQGYVRTRRRGFAPGNFLYAASE